MQAASVGRVGRFSVVRVAFTRRVCVRCCARVSEQSGAFEEDEENGEGEERGARFETAAARRFPAKRRGWN